MQPHDARVEAGELGVVEVKRVAPLVREQEDVADAHFGPAQDVGGKRPEPSGRDEIVQSEAHASGHEPGDRPVEVLVLVDGDLDLPDVPRELVEQVVGEARAVRGEVDRQRGVAPELANEIGESREDGGLAAAERQLEDAPAIEERREVDDRVVRPPALRLERPVAEPARLVARVRERHLDDAWRALDAARGLVAAQEDVAPGRAIEPEQRPVQLEPLQTSHR